MDPLTSHCLSETDPNAAKNSQDLDVFAELLKKCAPSTDPESVVNTLGIETLQCLKVIETYDFVNLCGLKIVQARKIIAGIELLLKGSDSSGESPDVASKCLENAELPLGAHELGREETSPGVGEEDTLFLSRSPVQTHGKTPARRNNSVIIEPESDESDKDFDYEAAAADEAEAERGSGPNVSNIERRRRKESRQGKKRSYQSVLNHINGSKRVCLTDPISFGAMKSGVGRPGVAALSKVIAGKTCRCAEKLEAVLPQLVGAVRSESERQARAKQAGVPVGKVSLYNLSRLAPLAVSLFFDSLGNFVYHGVCTRKKLNLGKTWLSATHRRAVTLSQVPVQRVQKKSLSKVDDDFLRRIVVPDGVCQSAKEYLHSCDPEDRISVIKDRTVFHGLAKRPSNRTKLATREFVAAFIRQNSSPNGRTRDTNGRYHGAPNYLDAKFLLYIEERPGEERLGFADECVRCMSRVEPFLSNPSLLIEPRTARSILKELFGKMKFVHGVAVYNEDYTIRYPQKTDACSDCVRISQQLSSDRQSLKRHQQQNDRGLDRMQAIADWKTCLSDHESALKDHTDEAGRASKFHKDCVSGAFNSYADVSTAWDSLLAMGDSATEDTVNQFCDAASSLWLDISTDYQQDKSVPSWGESPQSGPTYYLSGVTNYIHIIVIESCGLSTGPSRLSRNVVYIRDERVAGSKTSDDTLSTIADALLSRPGPTARQPSKFRSGYDYNGKLH